jgi:hypothetical protein
MTNTAEELEHAEHMQHAAHSPFDRKVAMTMAIVAACLACMTMLSHRAHTATLYWQAQASDKWNQYQAKKIRQYEYEAYLLMLAALAKDPAKEEAAAKAQKTWQDHVDKYKDELVGMGKDAHEDEERSHGFHAHSDRFDLGELGTELALVLCSLAVLTKRAPFWYVGVTIGAIGLIVGLTAFTIPIPEAAHRPAAAATTEEAPHH